MSFPKKVDNIREAGEDLKKGEVCISKHKTLTPADLGLLASIGVSRLSVFRKPKVAIFSTGDEIKNPMKVYLLGKSMIVIVLVYQVCCKKLEWK